MKFIKAFLFSLVLGIFTSHLAHADPVNGNGPPVTNNTVSNHQSVSARQDNEVSFTGMAPGLAGAAYDCNIESKSYSILLWSYGKAKCEPGSLIWRDIRNLAHYSWMLGLNEVQLHEAVRRRACSDKKFAKMLGNCPVRVRVVTDSERH